MKFLCKLLMKFFKFKHKMSQARQTEGDVCGVDPPFLPYEDISADFCI